MHSNNAVSWIKAWGGSIFAIAISLFFAFSLPFLFLYIVMYTLPSIPFLIPGLILAVLYPLLTFLSLKVFIEKILKIPLKTLRFSPFRLNLGGVLIGILLPALILIVYNLLPGEWIVEENLTSDYIYNVMWYGISIGITEEMVFRGVVMGLLEKCYKFRAALIVSSVIFASLHLVSGFISPLSTIQLIVSGSIMGVLLGLVGYYYNSFWNNALIHALWNALLLVVFYIGTGPTNISVFTYVLESQSPLVTGGDFGFESSAVSTLAILFYTGIMVYVIKRQQRIAAGNS